MSKHLSRSLGRWGEDWIRDEMLASGWSLWQQNLRAKGFEVDLLMQKGETLALIEVKTRCKNQDIGAVLSAAKCRALQRAAAYLWQKRVEVRKLRMRIDLAVLRLDEKNGWKLKYFPAVLPTHASDDDLGFG
jgi:putative endonuclease